MRYRAGVVILLAVALAACGDDGGGTGDDGGSPGDGGGASGDGGPGPDAAVADPPSACDYDDPAGAVTYVATGGSDETGDGSEGAPWATITHALDNVADGTTILVAPGTYTGRIRMRGTFATGVTVRSEVPYMARLRHDETVMTFYTHPDGVDGITVEGFDIAHTPGPSAGALVVHIDGGGNNEVRRITLRNNIMHDSLNNDILKINNGISEVVVERNLFFNQTGEDEHIDLNSADGVVIQDNIFMNDFAASGRTNGNDTSSYIVVKDSNGPADIYTGSRNIVVRRNVFVQWQGDSGTGFLLFGEDGAAYVETVSATVENNLFLGNSPVLMRAPFGIKGSTNIVFRNNTTAGDMPARALLRFNREGANPIIDGIEMYNNIWSDPEGTMGAIDDNDGHDFSDVDPGHIDTFTISNNLYYNGGNAIPEDGAEAINWTDDSAAVPGDPMLADPSGLTAPHWNGTAFADGSSDVCEAFAALVASYGTPAAGGAGVDVADPANAPADDIMGQPRGNSPDIGAVER